MTLYVHIRYSLANGHGWTVWPSSSQTAWRRSHGRLQAAAQPRMVLPSVPAAQELRPGVRPSEWVGFKGHLIVETMFFLPWSISLPCRFCNHAILGSW